MKRFSRLILLLGTLLLTLAFVMPAAATADSQANWQAQFFNNCCLVDPPTVTTTVERIDFTWSSGAPISGINADNFSARFNASVYFPRGTYRFYFEADDVARLSINLEPIINTINGGQTGSQLTADRFLDGIYNLQVDYVEHTGDAFLRIKWENLSTASQPVNPASTATVLVNVLNVRSEPSLNGAILTKVSRGQVFGVVARSADGAWVQINANGVVGWVSAPLVRVGGSATPAPTPAPQPGSPTEFSITALANLRLRSAPVISNNTLTTIPAGGTARVIGRDASTTWLKVDFAGQQGWVSIRYVRVNPPLRVDAVPVLTQ